MSTQLTESTIAASLVGNAAIDQAVNTIVSEITEASAQITGVKPADPDLTSSYEQALEQFARDKGRGAALPYIGSGVGHGPLVELCDGSVKYDLICGIGVHLFGHSEPDLIATAVRAAMQDVAMQGNLQFNRETIDFARLLVEQASAPGDGYAGSDIAHAFVINSGALANESAMKICFQKNAPASRVLAFDDTFAGRTHAMAQVGDSAGGRVGLPLNLMIDYVPFYDPDRHDESIAEAQKWLKKYIARYPGQHAVFNMELIQGEGGFRIAPREFLLPLIKLCRENSIGVWADEVQTFGRTEQMFYFQQLDLGEYVDVVTIGKMSQVCACLYTADYNPKPGLLSATFVGSTVGLAVGRRLLERLRDGGYYGSGGRIARLQRVYREHAVKLVADNPDCFPDVPHEDGGSRDKLGFFGGIGGMMRLTPFSGDKPKIARLVKVLFEEGIVAFYCGHGPYHLRFLAPVGVLEKDHFPPIFEILQRALRRVAEEE